MITPFVSNHVLQNEAHTLLTSPIGMKARMSDRLAARRARYVTQRYIPPRSFTGGPPSITCLPFIGSFAGYRGHYRSVTAHRGQLYIHYPDHISSIMEESALDGRLYIEIYSTPAARYVEMPARKFRPVSGFGMSSRARIPGVTPPPAESLFLGWLLVKVGISCLSSRLALLPDSTCFRALYPPVCMFICYCAKSLSLKSEFLNLIICLDNFTIPE